jgi:hypothetical protein
VLPWCTHSIDATHVPRRRPITTAEIFEDEQRRLAVFKAEQFRAPIASEMPVDVMFAAQARHDGILDRLLDEHTAPVSKLNQPTQRRGVAASDRSHSNDWTSEHPMQPLAGVHADHESVTPDMIIATDPFSDDPLAPLTPGRLRLSVAKGYRTDRDAVLGAGQWSASR